MWRERDKLLLENKKFFIGFFAGFSVYVVLMITFLHFEKACENKAKAVSVQLEEKKSIERQAHIIQSSESYQLLEALRPKNPTLCKKIINKLCREEGILITYIGENRDKEERVKMTLVGDYVSLLKVCCEIEKEIAPLSIRIMSIKGEVNAIKAECILS